MLEYLGRFVLGNCDFSVWCFFGLFVHCQLSLYAFNSSDLVSFLREHLDWDQVTKWKEMPEQAEHVTSIYTRVNQLDWGGRSAPRGDSELGVLRLLKFYQQAKWDSLQLNLEVLGEHK